VEPRAVADVLHLEQLSVAQRARLQEAVRRLGEGLDWRTAAKLDLEGLRGHYAGDSVTSTALTRIISSYAAVLDDQSKLSILDEAIHSAPQQLANLIPNAKRVLEQKQDLNNQLFCRHAHYCSDADTLAALRGSQSEERRSVGL
jgi:hypothetical protein